MEKTPSGIDVLMATKPAAATKRFAFAAKPRPAVGDTLRQFLASRRIAVGSKWKARDEAVIVTVTEVNSLEVTFRYSDKDSLVKVWGDASMYGVVDTFDRDVFEKEMVPA
jgi:hypothetical protein